MPRKKETVFIVHRMKAPPRKALSRVLRCAFLLLPGFFLILSACFAAAELASLPTGVEIRTQVSPETAAVGDHIRIDIEVAAPRSYRIEFMEPEQQTGDFFIFEFLTDPVMGDSEDSVTEKPGPESNNDARRRNTVRIDAAVYKTGTSTFPGITVYITDDRGHKTGIRTPTAEIEIESILTGNNPDLRDLKKQADIPAGISWLPWVLFGSIACVLAAAAWYILRKYRKASPEAPALPVQDPLVLAESALRDLIERKLPEKGRTKKFYVLLSEIVKRILEAAYGVATAERTTIEIMDSLYRNSGINVQSPEALRSLLMQCDMVKFAKYIPSEIENSRAAEDAFRILADAKEYSRQSAVGSQQSAVGSQQ